MQFVVLTTFIISLHKNLIMRNILFLSLILLITASCNISTSKRVKGNGQLMTKDRSVQPAQSVKVVGFIDVELVKDDAFKVTVVADENLHNYIEVKNDEGWLIVKPKNNVNIKTMNPVKVFIHLSELDRLTLAGSGNVRGVGKLTNESDMQLAILGSGDVDVALNCPVVEAKITGSGNCRITGETRDLEIKILGSGDFEGRELKAENATINITGSGDAYVFADVNLDASVIGSGDVVYRGQAHVEKKVRGSGTVRKGTAGE